MGHGRAALLLVVYLLFFVLGTPGLDFLEGDALGQPAARLKLEEKVGPFWATVGLGIYDVSRVTRTPLVNLLSPLQRPFRISQNWSLYRDGPSDCGKLEVQVDGRPIYRSVDATLNWNEEIFRNRRIRPVVESTVQESNSLNWRGLTRMIQRRAQVDFPDMRELRLLALRGRFPCDKMHEHHRIVATAPDWIPVATVAGRPVEDPGSHDEN